MSSSYFRLLMTLAVFLSLFLVSNWVYFSRRSMSSVMSIPTIFSMPPKSLVPSMSLPSKEQLNSMSESDLFDLYHVFLETVTYHCRNIIRAGSIEDGGWNVCVDPKYIPKKPCLIYSFGIGYDSSFDTFVRQKFGCEVHSFDPTLNDPYQKKLKTILNFFHPIGLSDKNQEVGKIRYKTLKEIRRSLGHLQTEISILKIDIEMWEWRSLKHSIPNKMLDDVNQLLIEFHSYKTEIGHRKEYLVFLAVLRELHDLGFRAFSAERNIHCNYQTKNKITHTSCHNIFFVKTN